MKTIFLLAFISIINFPVFSQSTKLFDDYKIPTYSFNTLQLASQDFLKYLKVKSDEIHQDDESINVNFNLYDRFVRQSPFYTGISEVKLNYFYNMEKRNEFYSNYPKESTYKERKDERSQMFFYINSMNDFYINNERGIFLSGNFSWSYNYYTPMKNFITETGITVGGGYGRIVGLRSVVQAYIISKETGSNLSDSDIQKLSEIIEKWSNGYYSKYKDNSDIEFYKDIISITQKPEQITKIQQILNSQIYKTAERMDGMKVNATLGYANIGGDNFFFSEARDLVNISLKAEYAKPIGFDKQAYVSAEYSKNLDDKENSVPRLKLSGRFSIDHNLTWSSSLNVEYTTAYLKNTSNRANFKAGFSTNFTIINALTAYGTVSYVKQQFHDSQIYNSGGALTISPESEWTELHLGLRYYIL